jgi:hypothetical protein
MTAWNHFNWKLVPANCEESLKTLKQREVFTILRNGGKPKDVKAKFGMADNNVYDLIHRTRKALNSAGYDPENGMTLVSPALQILKGRSALVRVDEHGKETVAMYWNKTDTVKENQLNIFRDVITELSRGIKPFSPVKPAKTHDDDLLTVYTLTDFHLGMYSWADETGANWDMKIAETVMLNAFADMMAGSPASKVAVFAQLGDLLHWDGLMALTPTAKNVLDADTRFPSLVQVAISVCLKAIEMLLRKHETVHVIMAEGNHDMASSVWLRAIMKHTFKNNPRVTCDDSPFPFYHYKWGDTFLGWHHGHLQKMENLPLLFATDPKFKADYGQCHFTYIHTGHMHHQKVIDRGGIVVEQHPTLSARDAHGARGFLSSNRETKAITYHKLHGERSRYTVRPNLTPIQ